MSIKEFLPEAREGISGWFPEMTTTPVAVQIDQSTYVEPPGKWGDPIRDPIGTVKVQNGGSCYTAGLGGAFSSQCKAHMSGEWDYAGESDWEAGGCGWGLKKNLCRKAQHLGDKSGCCTELDPITGNTTCDPRYITDRYTSADCASAWESRCNTGDILKTDGRCGIWAKANPNKPKAIAITKQFCESRMEDPWCQSWSGVNKDVYDYSMEKYCALPGNIGKSVCLNWCVSNPGKCDEPMRLYCAGKDASGVCACLNSKSLKYAPNPRCYDAACLRTGYLNTQMLRECPDTVDCSVAMNLRAGGEVEVTDLVVDQNCGNQTVDVPNDDSAVATTNPAETSKKERIMMILVLVGIALLVIAGVTGLVLFLRSRNKNKENNESDQKEDSEDDQKEGGLFWSRAKESNPYTKSDFTEFRNYRSE